MFWFLVLFKLRFKIIWSPKSDPNRSLDGYRNMLEREKLGVCIMFIKLKCCGFTMFLVMTTTSSNSTIHSGPMQELIWTLLLDHLTDPPLCERPIAYLIDIIYFKCPVNRPVLLDMIKHQNFLFKSFQCKNNYSFILS